MASLIERLSFHGWTKAPVALALLLAALFGWRVLAHGAADFLAARDPRAALSLDGAHPLARTLLAQSELAKPEAAQARAAAADAALLLSRDPLAPGALSLYGAAMARIGETQRAQKIMRLAAAHLPIDLVAQSWLYESALKRGALSEALTELDILLRGRPILTPQLGPSVVALIGAGEAGEAGLAGLLGTAPPWRASMVAYLSSELKDSTPLTRLFDYLQASNAPPTPPEMRFYLERLVRDGEFETAYLAWLNHLPPERLSQLGLLYNGRFQYSLSDLPFDWRIVPIRGASVEVGGSEGKPSLNAEFFGGKVSFAHVSHLLMLPAGRYVFSGLAGADQLDNERGLHWRIFCVGDVTNSLATTDFLKGTTSEKPFRVAFSVPAEGCAAQTLLLEIPARIAAELRVSGAARYRDLSIERAGNVAK